MSRPVRFTALVCCLLGVMAAMARAENTKGNRMSYAEVRAFLAKHTRIVELANDAGARVVIAPEMQGRVMTSTCGGSDGHSFGFVNRKYIEAGKLDLHMANPGAEDRMWLCPEGGPFSLWFKPGAKQVIKNWFTPPALNVAAWQVVSKPSDPDVRMATHMKLENTSAATFELDARRQVRLLAANDFRELFGEDAAAKMSQDGVKVVGYETANQVTHRGPDFDKQKGLISIWILGMMNAGPRTMIIVPYKPGPESELGPVVKSDYFGVVPAERLRMTSEAVLFRADAKYRSKIGVSQRRVRNVVGSIDFDAGVLTLVHFSMPLDPTKHIYLNNMWGLPQADPYHGDVVNAYNDGPNDLGAQMGSFYEIESISPAPILKSGESLTHRQQTIHVQAAPAILRALAKDVLGVDLEHVKAALQ
ncbi:MAG: hypothetical protein LLG00_14025 [Planctomycetaceae bacterium]|nr:hypothetical protein [Planctomycetaceae bacterium]